jgi:hypothetical protein
VGFDSRPVFGLVDEEIVALVLGDVQVVQGLHDVGLHLVKEF